MSHCWDTSAFIHSWRRTSPPDIFVSLWDKLDAEIRASSIVCPDEVYRELERRDDPLFRWVKDRKDALFVPLERTLQAHVATIGGVFPYYTAGDSDDNAADPWVVALAMERGLTVVTQETRQGSLDFPKIPRVCDRFGVRYVNTFDYMRAKGWTF